MDDNIYNHDNYMSKKKLSKVVPIVVKNTRIVLKPNFHILFFRNIFAVTKKSVFLQLKFSCNEQERKTNKTLT